MTDNLEENLYINDNFLTGLSDTNQKKYVLEQRLINDDLNALLQFAIKFESIQILIQPNVSHQGYKLWKEDDKGNKVN